MALLFMKESGFFISVCKSPMIHSSIREASWFMLHRVELLFQDATECACIGRLHANARNWLPVLFISASSPNLWLCMCVCVCCMRVRYCVRHTQTAECIEHPNAMRNTDRSLRILRIFVCQVLSRVFGTSRRVEEDLSAL